MIGRRHGRHAATMPKHTSACDQIAAPTSESGVGQSDHLVRNGRLLHTGEIIGSDMN